jgi:formate hydrogenlyase subunit 3/multisubunit Na+/H+ antiporter MnhD subunit
VTLLLLAFGTVAAGGLFALLLGRRPRLATNVAAVTGFLGGLGTLGAAGLMLADARPELLLHEGGLAFGRLLLVFDPLAAVFLVPLGLVGALAMLYGRAYAPERHGVAAGLNLLFVSVGLVLLADGAGLFLLGWEVMTILAFLLVTADHRESAAARRAGWTLLVASHVGVLALFAYFLAPPPTSIFLALVGFGVKAGLVGGHGWLPEAHAAAPSHVSAFMSGVLVNAGIYGLVRAIVYAPMPSWFGALLGALGLLGALVGVSLAFYQRDLKRVLAYSTVENLGIILAAIGFGAWAVERHDREIAGLCFSAAFLHLWNHSLMKGLLFLGAGSIVHATGERDIERLGGLYRRMPWTGSLWILGATAIAGLPPLNGFVGEFLLYQGLARGAAQGQPGGVALASIAALGALALVGGLALACFVRLLGIVLLGSPRSPAAAAAHESPRGMLAPMVVLGALCLGMAVSPVLAHDLFGSAVRSLEASDFPPASLGTMTYVNLGVGAALLLVVGALLWRVRGAARTETWGCGYGHPTARMQYTGGSFAEIFTWRLLPRWFRPRQTVRPPEGLFPREAARASDAEDPFTRGAFRPFVARMSERFARWRWLQQGSLHLYLLYIVVAAVLGLVWMSVR